MRFQGNLKLVFLRQCLRDQCTHFLRAVFFVQERPAAEQPYLPIGELNSAGHQYTYTWSGPTAHMGRAMSMLA